MGQETLTILLVEDDELLMMSFSDMLRDMGHQVFEAPMAAAALACLKDNAKIDILITDIQMPDMNGPELVKLVRELAPNLPVIYSSGHRRDKVADLDTDRWTRFLEKPFGPAELTETFRSFSIDAAA
jgi:DNA-binding NtrC family response regulator